MRVCVCGGGGGGGGWGHGEGSVWICSIVTKHCLNKKFIWYFRKTKAYTNGAKYLL